MDKNKKLRKQIASIEKQKKVTRTRKTKTQTTRQKETVNPIHATLTAEFNPIFQEMLDWMTEVQFLAVKLRSMAADDKKREKLETELEWRLTQIKIRSAAIVEQVFELMPD